jgi:hypothetical protein
MGASAYGLNRRDATSRFLETAVLSASWPAPDRNLSEREVIKVGFIVGRHRDTHGHRWAEGDYRSALIASESSATVDGGKLAHQRNGCKDFHPKKTLSAPRRGSSDSSMPRWGRSSTVTLPYPHWIRPAGGRRPDRLSSRGGIHRSPGSHGGGPLRTDPQGTRRPVVSRPSPVLPGGNRGGERPRGGLRPDRTGVRDLSSTDAEFVCPIQPKQKAAGKRLRRSGPTE